MACACSRWCFNLAFLLNIIPWKMMNVLGRCSRGLSSQFLLHGSSKARCTQPLRVFSGWNIQSMEYCRSQLCLSMGSKLSVIWVAFFFFVEALVLVVVISAFTSSTNATSVARFPEELFCIPGFIGGHCVEHRYDYCRWTQLCGHQLFIQIKSKPLWARGGSWPTVDIIIVSPV